MSEWKPIESAPKDGTAVLVFGRGTFSQSPFMGVREWGAFGWQEPNVSGREYDDWLADEATHWTELPSPPGEG
ncbi:MAG TPA: DUF551 domain-containing protein [Brevundimonas sp.]|jgi:hypothetical protein|uniref:DUF551 domain-containing protein n=1 Tax=Brevundimonas sp. TaxID=1871086 RepID=UPI002E14B4CB|nr:DUF551 domain-containing protein [Brevundimonas sp.]